MLKTVIIIGMVTVVLVGGILYRRSHSQLKSKPASVGLRYIAVGDSYTVGQGVRQEEAWPSLLVADLNKQGQKTTLVANLAQTAYTTQDVIDRELPTLEQEKPDFATVQIGVNDYVQGVSSETFKANFDTIIDRMIASVSRRDRVIVVTIPDFSVTPAGQSLAHGHEADLASGVAAFNAIITAEAQSRNLKVVDVFGVSQKVKDDSSLVAADGLHPSAKEYIQWERLIYPMVAELLK